MSSNSNSNPYAKPYNARDRNKKTGTALVSPPPKKKRSGKVDKTKSPAPATASKKPPTSKFTNNHLQQVIANDHLQKIIADDLNASASARLAPQVAVDKAPVAVDSLPEPAPVPKPGINNLLQASGAVQDPSSYTESNLRDELEILDDIAAPDFTSPSAVQGIRDEWSGDMNLRAEQRAFNAFNPNTPPSLTQTSTESQSKGPQASTNDGTSTRCNKCGLVIDNDLIEYHTCNSIGAFKAPVKTKTPEDWTVDDEIEAANRNFNHRDAETEEGIKLMEATVHSDKHEARRSFMHKKFIQNIILHKDDFGTLADLVQDSTGQMVPKLFTALAGANPSMSMIRLASRAYFNLAFDIRNEKAKGDACPYLEPATQNTYFRTLSGYMKECYDWHYSLQHDFNFAGGYYPRVCKLYAVRMIEYPGLGTGQNKQIPDNAEVSSDVNLSKFEEDIHYEHQQLVMMICGMYFGTRGREEVAYLLVSQIIQGWFEESSEYKGYRYIGISGMPDKSKKVTPTNSTARDTSKTMRIPILDINSKTDPGAIFKRYVDKCHPQQKRLFCKEASLKTKRRHFLEGYPNATMSIKQPLGVNMVAKMIKEASVKAGLNCTGHGNRRLYISSLVNNPGVSEQESLASSRHSSVSAQKTYQMRNHQSEAQKFAALGLKKNDDRK